MRKYLAIALLVCTSVVFCQENPPIIIDADFDRGSIGKLEEIKSGYLKGTTKHWIKNDNIGNQYYWFCFALENVKDREITVELGDLTGIYRGNKHEIYTDYTYPVYSYDKVNWARIDDVSYDDKTKTFIFKKAFSKNKVCIAYAHPYFYSRLIDLIALIEEDKNVDVDYFGRSSRENSLPRITITNKESQKEKKLIFIQAMQHSGEDAGGFFIEGMIRYLLSADSLAREVLNDIEFVFAPILNPDGYYMGTSRYSSAMGDLNSQWVIDNSDTKVETEVKATQLLLDKLNKNKGIDLFIDIHCHGQDPGMNEIISEDESIKGLYNLINNYWSIHYKIGTFNNSASAYIAQKYEAPSFTMELSQSYADKTKRHLTIYDYFRYGEDFTKSIYEFFLISDK